MHHGGNVPLGSQWCRLAISAFPPFTIAIENRSDVAQVILQDLGRVFDMSVPTACAYKVMVRCRIVELRQEYDADVAEVGSQLLKLWRATFGARPSQFGALLETLSRSRWSNSFRVVQRGLMALCMRFDIRTDKVQNF